LLEPTATTQTGEGGWTGKREDQDDKPDGIRANTEVVRIAYFSNPRIPDVDRISHRLATVFAFSDAVDYLRISKTCLIQLCNDDFTG